MTETVKRLKELVDSSDNTFRTENCHMSVWKRCALEWFSFETY